jgi:microcystin-dependent protein
MSEPFLGEIRMFGFGFAPRGWALCGGQILSIAQNTALFSLLGTNYGGDGKTTFALPDLQGRVPMHWGQGPGLTDRALGESSGIETVTITSSEMAAHTHSPQAASGAGNQYGPAGGFWASDAGGAAFYAPTANTQMNSGIVGNAGGNGTGASNPHNNLQPYRAVNFCIALEGIFPARN